MSRLLWMQVTADDGSVWEKVSLHGFVDINNTDIVALTPYKGNLYALTRNDVSGFELWKTDPAQGWQRIHVQGFTDQSDYYGYLQQFKPGCICMASLRSNTTPT